MEIKKIGVVGAGTMGHGIALVSAATGYEVILQDIKEEFVKTGIEKINRFLEKSIEKGKMTQEEKADITARLAETTELEKLKDCDIIIEAIFEDVKIKKE